MAWRRWVEDGWYPRWRPYVPVAERRANARRAIAKLEKKTGRKAEPVEIEGRTIAHTFWGKAWCENLERYSDFENRLPRGKTYVRNGSVIDLQLSARKVEALVSGSDHPFEDGGTGRRAAEIALRMAGMTVDDIDVMEVHDASSPAELMLYEELGLCPPGEGGRLIDEGATELGGRIPVNPSGGLISKGHPVGATGVSQAYEIWLHLRG